MSRRSAPHDESTVSFFGLHLHSTCVGSGLMPASSAGRACHRIGNKRSRAYDRVAQLLREEIVPATDSEWQQMACTQSGRPPRHGAPARAAVLSGCAGRAAQPACMREATIIVQRHIKRRCLQAIPLNILLGICCSSKQSSKKQLQPITPLWPSSRALYPHRLVGGPGGQHVLVEGVERQAVDLRLVRLPRVHNACIQTVMSGEKYHTNHSRRYTADHLSNAPGRLSPRCALLCTRRS